MKRIGPTFDAELRAAGVASGVSWSDDGIAFCGMTPEDEAIAMAVYEAHNPDAPSISGIIASIIDLEEKQHRATREVMLGDLEAIDRLEEIDAQIASLRAQLHAALGS